MDLTILYFLTNMLALILEQEAFSVSISAADHGSEKGFQAQLRERAAPRVKRCSCENLRDKECVYFCHIGIVWINTPGQIVPYGVGSFPVRLRREAARCVCVDGSDSQCHRFCTALHLLKRQVGITPFKRMFPSKSREKYKSGQQMEEKLPIQET